jgi:DNA polymerase-3 subunit beta
VGAKIEKEGSITVPARVIGGFLSTISDEVVIGNLETSELKLKSENHTMKIKGINAKDFPIIPDLPEHSFFSVNSELFAKAVSGVLISVAHNDTRQELNGVLMNFENEQITLASTDSFRLTEVVVDKIKIEAKDEYDAYKQKMPSIIIPALALSELQRITTEGDLRVVVDQNQLFISTKSTKIISRLINGNYPEYRQVLPKKYDINVNVDKQQLIDALKIASLVANNQNGEVQFTSGKGGNNLVLKSQSIDTGDNISKVEAKIKGPEFEVLFNCRYLIEGLNSVLFDGVDVQLNLNKQKSPVLLKNTQIDKESQIKFSYVIMPIIKG